MLPHVSFNAKFHIQSMKLELSFQWSFSYCKAFQKLYISPGSRVNKPPPDPSTQAPVRSSQLTGLDKQ